LKGLKTTPEGYIYETAAEFKAEKPYSYERAVILMKRGLSDGEIAKRLGLIITDIRLVREEESQGSY
jgi:hypothetical protein